MFAGTAVKAITASTEFSDFAQLLMITSRVMTFWRRRMHGQNTVYPKSG